MKQGVLVVQPIHQSGLAVFDAAFDVRVATDPGEATVIKEIAGAHGAICRTAPFSRAIIEAAPHLRVIGRHGVGVDNIDVAAATERGIVVVNTPEANAQSVAEHVVIAIGALAKRVLPMHRAVVEGNWGARNEYAAIDLAGKTLGVVGLGRIGSLVAQKCAAAYGMRVVAYDPYADAERALSMRIALLGSLDELLPQADFVTLHTPLTAATYHLIDGPALARMKPTSYLVNMSRGEVVDEAALLVALQSRAIAGAALDVYEHEPPSAHNPLFELESVLLSPHSAALTQECVIRMATGAAQGVRDVLEGYIPQFVVNPEVLAGLELRRRP